jgi:hypothetical protein
LEGFELVDSLRKSFKQKVEVLIELNQEVATHAAQVRNNLKAKVSMGDAVAIASKERNKLLTKERMRRLRERNKI